MKKDLAYYRALPYTRRIDLEEEGGQQYFVASVVELPGCFAVGQTREDAIANLKTVFDDWIQAKLAWGSPIPEPERGHYSGRPKKWKSGLDPDMFASGPDTEPLNTREALTLG